MAIAPSEALLFELDPVVEGGSGERKERVPVDKTFRTYDQNQMLLLPPSLEDWLPEDHLGRFVNELVEGEILDMSGIRASYVEERGYPPYDPRLMLKLLIYGYCTGCRSSRGIEKRCKDDVAFRYLSAGVAPDYRSIARFRRRHLKALEGMFVQTLELCRRAGMVRMGKVALDGTKLRANASRHKAMSYGRMVEKEESLKEEVRKMLAEAEQVDAEEDERLGKDNRDDDLPGELARRETRLAKIKEAKESLVAEARESAAKEAKEKAEGKKLDEEGVDAAVQAAVEKAVPKPKAQRNFTDPESRIMKTADGSFHQCYNGQAVVDDGYQVIVAADITQCASDSPSLEPMLEQTNANCGQLPGQFLADAGYCSEDNLKALEKSKTDAYIATGRWPHGEPPPPIPSEPVPENATPKERMAHKTRTKEGREIYARRKAIVEPAFGQMMTLQGARHLLLRGKEAVTSEWRLLCACHNLRKLFGVTGGASGLTLARRMA